MNRIKTAITLVTAIFLILAMSMVSYAGSVFSDVEDGCGYENELLLLKTLGIVSGDGDGTLRPYDSLSRAEFAKLVVHVLDEQQSAMSNSGQTGYYDVEKGHWAVRYINYVSKNKIILGYPDGSFCPDEEISFAQAITVTLRALGYSAEQIGDFWPDNYIQKALGLGLTENMNYGADDIITRADAVLLLGRALEAPMSDSAPTAKKTLLDRFGYSVIEDAVVIASYESDKSLAADQIKTQSATYKTLSDDVFSMIGSKAKLYLDEDKQIILALEQKQYSRSLVVVKQLGEGEYSCISADADDEFEYSFDDNFTLYYEGKSGNYASLKDSIQPGCAITLKGAYEGVWEYAVIDASDKIPPVVATRDFVSGDTYIGDVKLENIDKIKVYRDGYSAQLTDIKRNDVVYYNPAVNTVNVYIDKVTGTYDKAMPNKAYVTSVEIGGNVFEIETANATSKLDETPGSFKINDRITLLLGKDGKVAGVTSSANDAALDYAVLLSVVTEISSDESDKGASVYKATLMQTDGKTYTYKTKKLYSDYVGTLVKMKFEEGVLSLSKVISNDLEGYYDKKENTIASKAIASGAAIFDLTGIASNTAQVTKIEQSDIKTTYIYKESIISYAVTNSFGEIGVILFDNITNSDISFGILSARKVSEGPNGFSGSYTVNVNGVETTYSKAVSYASAVGTPVKISASGQSLNLMESLTKVASANKVSAIDYDRIRVGNETFSMDENVIVYRLDPKTLKYITVSKNDLLASNVASVELWADASVSRGGIVRIIKVAFSG